MIPVPSSSTRTDTPFPSSTLFRSSAEPVQAQCALPERRTIPSASACPRTSPPRLSTINSRPKSVWPERHAANTDAAIALPQLSVSPDPDIVGEGHEHRGGFTDPLAVHRQQNGEAELVHELLEFAFEQIGRAPCRERESK